MDSPLKPIFITLTALYTSNTALAEKLWQEIETMYTGKSRYYHTLAHLENLLIVLEDVKANIKDWETVLFAIFYHDIVYKATSKSNEEDSAGIASKRLGELGFPKDRTEKCVSLILATKAHTTGRDTDTDYFTDADLSILGQTQDTYLQYAKQVRKEFSIYPDLLYNPGRKKVLNHFLNMERIFKTQYFFDKFEKQARENLMNELKAL